MSRGVNTTRNTAGDLVCAVACGHGGSWRSVEPPDAIRWCAVCQTYQGVILLHRPLLGELCSPPASPDSSATGKEPA